MCKNVSLILVFLVSAYVILFTLHNAPWKQKKIIDQDVTYYYGYLPATFIYHDWRFRFPDKQGFTGHVWSLALPDGGRIQKMTMGVALLYLPFFLAAHLWGKHSILTVLTSSTFFFVPERMADLYPGDGVFANRNGFDGRLAPTLEFSRGCGFFSEYLCHFQLVVLVVWWRFQR